MSSTGSTAARAVVSVASWSLDMSQDKIDVTAFGDTNKVTVAGLRGLAGTFDGFWDDEASQLFAGAHSDDGVNLYLYPSSLVMSYYAGGAAWIDCSLSTGVNEAIKITSKFEARGSWVINL